YTIRAPCRIHVSVREHADGRSLFIHPEDQELSDTAKDLKEDVLKLCDESGQVVDGWKREVVISTDLVDASGRMLLFKNDQGELEEGCVRTPVLLPNDTDTTLMDAEDDHLTFRKNADLQEDGTYLIRTSIFPT
ncbi:MAG: hypothetical protein U9R75_08140, partial [Candidatus Thermoplasmatota archaeon]|nr:hypothetical protein [Candidatus Thermoplasmatota archaeon]